MTAKVEQDVPFSEALRRVWVSNASGTIRNVFAGFTCLVLLGVQVAMVAMADNEWALLGVVFLPLAAWFLVRGWVYQVQGWRALGLLFLGLGGLLPFYLAAV